MKKFLKIILIIALIGVLCCTYYFYRKQEIKDAKVAKIAQQYNAALKKVREEKASLIEERKLLYEDLYLPDRGSTIVLLADTCIEHLDDTIYLMDQWYMHGVIALSPYHFPDDNDVDYLNREQIDELVSNGFELVITINNEDINSVYNSFIEKGYDIKGFYFENVKVNKARIDEVRKIDPELVAIGDYDEGLYYNDYLLIHSYGSKQSGVKTAYNDSIGVSKTMALTVGYKDTNSQYTYENFTAMLNLISNYEYYGETMACNISEAKLRYQEYLDLLSIEKTDAVNRISEIEKRLNDIDSVLFKIGK